MNETKPQYYMQVSPSNGADLISRAEVLEGLKHSTAYLHDDIYTIVNRIPSAEATGALDDAITKYVADGYMLPPSGDLISRADVIRLLVEKYKFTTSEATEILSALPSTEAVQGEWIKATGMMPPEFPGHHCCSKCGNFANMESPFGKREDLSDFCPNCGARMKGAEYEID